MMLLGVAAMPRPMVRSQLRLSAQMLASRIPLCLAFSLLPYSAASQAHSSRADAASLMQQLRGGNNRAPVAELRQLSGPRSRAALDELADSLTNFVITASGDESQAVNVFAALSAIGRSGSRRSDGGVPYAGAGARLSRIIEEAPMWAGGALIPLTRLQNRAEGIERLSAVAQSESPSAPAAVEILDHYGGEPGEAELRRLYRGPSLASERARAVLATVAARRGWERTRRKLDAAKDALGADTGTAAVNAALVVVVFPAEIFRGFDALVATTNEDGP